MALKEQLKLGITHPFPCGYLPELEEQLLVVMDHHAFNSPAYEELLELGFRRSGTQIYRPHCAACKQCQSLRIPVQKLNLSRSQKRTLAKAKDLRVTFGKETSEDFYPLFERYIETRHKDGDMYPPSPDQYKGFIPCEWLDVHYLCLYDKDKLISVSVIDVLGNAFSALYTYFDPDYSHYSPGKLSILIASQFARDFDKQWFYLGYYIKACDKMSYKAQFKPHQRFVLGDWVDSE